MSKYYVALMSVQFIHAESGERLWAEPLSASYHGVFDGLADEEAERLIKLGAIREAEKEEVAVANVSDSQTKPIELSEQAKQAAAEAEEAFRATAAKTGGKTGGKTSGKPEAEEEPAI